LIGCAGKSNSTPPGDTPEPKTEPLPNQQPSTKTTPSGAPPSDSKEKMKVEIAKGVFVINGTAVPLPGGLPEFEKVLDKPSGTSDRGGYRAVYWKSLGVKALQEKSGQQRIVTVQFHLEEYDDVFDNVKCDPFPGVIILEGERVTKDTDMAEVGKKVSGLKETVLFKWELKYPDWASVYIDATFKVGPKGAPQKGVRQVTVENLK
jgi:hypothetical protein